ncbi:MAG: 3-deoxy-7-phosphoheptulonate synthase [Chloroflexi bacterium]|nr:3-deoxy-7-phosphoheptulonate synthase [Chloroflexota bacterium]MCZ6865955.1 3-deoxy-7-phosphoheptulonate synthase [Chloroflexota bacterium]
MIVVMRTGSTEAEIQAVRERIESHGLQSHLSQGAERTVIGVVGQILSNLQTELERLPGVAEVVRISKPYKLSTREFKEGNTTVKVGDAVIGGSEPIIIAGPCAVESEEQLMSTAKVVKEQGAKILRGGAFKPRTSPYSFRGLGVQGLKLLAEAGEKFGMPVVTEVMSPEDVGMVASYADILQIGARNAQNFNLLDAVGKIDKPVLLKRGFSSSYEEWLLAAEYVLSGGNSQVILCERGIRTFESYTRFTLDLAAVPAIKKLSHLPIIVDPSHSTGSWDLVIPVSLAAVAAGAHGIIVDVHPNPAVAKCDGAQALSFENFHNLAVQVEAVAQAISRVSTEVG